jgi:glyoxylase-like metal-dependent hydrolase (beta-lactamase superfamily II)
MTQHYQHYLSMHMALHERCFPHLLRDGVWIWSVYSEEKEIDFNGYLVQTSENESLIIDPPCEGPEVLESFLALPKPTLILLTNADHERQTQLFKQRFNIPVAISVLDAPLLTSKPDQSFQDGEGFPGGWQAIHIPAQKTPGECAFYNKNSKLLILGDALISKPYQRLSMLPAEKYRDMKQARQGLQCLHDLEVEAILTGDGDPITQMAKELLLDALRENES